MPISPHPKERRVAALVLDSLASELVSLGRFETTKGVKRREAPLGIVLIDEEDEHLSRYEPRECLASTERLDAVNRAASRLGIARGQTIVEARLRVAHLDVYGLKKSELWAVLQGLAESLWDRASVIAIELPDTIWLEVTEVSHLWGGERKLGRELVERMRECGHRARVVIARGPRVAQILARSPGATHQSVRLVESEDTAIALERLPTSCLPLARDSLVWLTRLGILTMGQLALLPEGALVDRCGAEVLPWLELARGHDDEPLLALRLSQVPMESFEWEHSIDGVEPLRFPLRRLTQALELRLEARKESALAIRMAILHDSAVARHRKVPLSTECHLELMAPLRYASQLERVLMVQLERLTLLAPSRGLTLEVTRLVRTVTQQMHFPFLKDPHEKDQAQEQALGILLGELLGEMPSTSFGVFWLKDDYRPECQSLLVPYRVEHELGEKGEASSPQSKGKSAPFSVFLRKLPSRLLRHPIPIESPVKKGQIVFVQHDPYRIERVELESRLEGIEWWNLPRATSRDYLRLYLSGAEGVVEVLAYLDHETRRCFLQGIVD